MTGQGKIVEIYDLWWKPYTAQELPFWIRICSDYIKRNNIEEGELSLVELCSGTGRVLFPLIKELLLKYPYIKITAIGLDYSEDMNKIFREKIKYESIVKDIIKVHTFDLRTKSWETVLKNRLVDIFIFPFNQFGLMGDPIAQENIVLNVSHYLTDGGIFTFVDYNPENRKLEDRLRKKIYRHMVSNDEKTLAIFYWREAWPLDNEHRYAGITYAADCVLWLEEGLSFETLSATMTIFYNSPEQIDNLLKKYKLETVVRYGGYNDEPMTNESYSQVVISRKADSAR
ncbi:MAG: class I SAM-dependent methyltransferase [bacterium]|nr:class I SAM-dependent methyltransferase [bacterium]